MSLNISLVPRLSWNANMYARYLRSFSCSESRVCSCTINVILPWFYLWCFSRGKKYQALHACTTSMFAFRNVGAWERSYLNIGVCSRNWKWSIKPPEDWGWGLHTSCDYFSPCNLTITVQQTQGRGGRTWWHVQEQLVCSDHIPRTRKHGFKLQEAFYQWSHNGRIGFLTITIT